MQRFLHTLLFFFICAVTQAQFSKHYTFTASSGTFNTIQGTGTHPALSSGNYDDGRVSNAPIGFTFNYDGKNYSTINIQTNGMASFAPITTITGLQLSTNLLRSLLAPLWDDIELSNSTNLTYQTSGVASNRVFTIEWSNALWQIGSPTPSISFQLKLYESTNVIEFVYKQEAGNFFDGPPAGAAIGISSTDPNGGAYSHITLKDVSNNPGLATGVTNYWITTKPATGQIYRFTPIPSLTFAGHYNFSASAGAFNSIKGTGIHPALSSGDYDDGRVSNAPIGFPFNYDGVNYSTINIQTNGMASFGAITTITGFQLSTNLLRSLLAPLWDDIDLSNSTNLTYQTSGLVPNRTFTIEWSDVLWQLGAPTPAISFQLKLYESTNVIEFVYKQEAGNFFDGPPAGAAIGISSSDPNGGANSHITLKDVSNNPARYSGDAVNYWITTKPATGQIYRFTPIPALQLKNRYLFSATNNSFTSIQTTGTHPGAFDGGNPFNGYVNNINIGFPFVYEDQVFTQLHASTNGFLKLGAALANGNPSSFLSTPGSLNYVLAPLLGTLDMTSLNNLTYATTGVQPDRVFTFEWTNAKWNYNAVAPVLTFQVKLYENESKVQFLYRQEASPVIQVGGGNSPFTSVGINGGTSPDQPTPQQFISLTSLTANPSTNSETEYVGTFTKPVTGQVYTFATGVTLAATITTLQAKLNGGIVDLQWQTSDEHNNKGFNVQKRDGDTWRTIGFVNGAGNSSATKDYSFTDIPKSGGTVLYRLEQVDLDGKTSLSNVVKVDLGKMIFSMEQFPNPATNRTTISYSLPNDETVSLQLFDNSGKLVRTIVNSKQTKGVYQFNIDVTKWSKGVYYYNFKAGKLKETKKLLVQ
jgi:hypothetical protein